MSGAGTFQGTTFQARAAAYYAVQMLEEFHDGWDLPQHSIVRIRLEAPTAVDDIVLDTEDGGRVYIQAKHDASGRSAAGPLAAAVAQFVELWRQGASTSAMLALDPSRDRLVILGGAPTSKTTRALKPLLDERRSHRPASPRDVSGLSETNARVLRDLIDRIDDAYGYATPDADLEAILSLTAFEVLEVMDGEADEKEVVKDLRRLVRRPKQARSAWEALCIRLATAAGRRSGLASEAIADVFARRDIALHDSVLRQVDTWPPNLDLQLVDPPGEGPLGPQLFRFRLSNLSGRALIIDSAHATGIGRDVRDAVCANPVVQPGGHTDVVLRMVDLFTPDPVKVSNLAVVFWGRERAVHEGFAFDRARGLGSTERRFRLVVHLASDVVDSSKDCAHWSVRSAWLDPVNLDDLMARRVAE